MCTLKKMRIFLIVIILIIITVFFQWYRFSLQYSGAQTISEERYSVNGDKIWFEYDGYGYASLPFGYELEGLPDSEPISRLKYESVILNIFGKEYIYDYPDYKDHEFLYGDYGYGLTSNFPGGDFYREDIVLPGLDAEDIDAIEFRVSYTNDLVLSVDDKNEIKQILDTVSSDIWLGNLSFLEKTFSLGESISTKVIFKKAKMVYWLDTYNMGWNQSQLEQTIEDTKTGDG